MKSSNQLQLKQFLQRNTFIYLSSTYNNYNNNKNLKKNVNNNL